MGVRHSIAAMRLLKSFAHAFRIPRLAKIIRLMIALAFVSLEMKAVGVSTDSSNFVKASLLVVSPGAEIYSVFGHCALRMECPSEGLDYCYTFEMESGLSGAVKFLSGQAKAGYAAVKTSRFLQGYAKEGRGVRQLTLNLTPHEKQELWRALDEEMMKGAYRHFNLIQNNCLSMSILLLESVLENEHIDFGTWPEPMTWVNGDGIRYLSRKAPWSEFIFMSLIGCEADTFWEQEYRMSPELIVPILRQARIVSTIGGSSRKALLRHGEILLPQRSVATPTRCTPTLLFGILLLVVLAITFAEWRYKWNLVPKWLDRILFVCQAVAGVFLLYVTVAAGLFGVHWNWYLIVFNPLPAVFWLCCRKRKIYRNLLGLYAVLLMAFIPVAWGVTTQADFAHMFIVAALAIRCAYAYINFKNEE